MDIIHAITERITTLDRQIAQLEIQRQTLRQARELLNGTEPLPDALPEPEEPRSREQILRDLISAAGKHGLSRQEVIKQMTKVCDSTPASISTMLTRLASHGFVRNVNHRWVPPLKAVA